MPNWKIDCLKSEIAAVLTSNIGKQLLRSNIDLFEKIKQIEI